MNWVLEARNLSKDLGVGQQSVPALKDVTLQVARGEFVAIVGPSGSGKSTLLQLLGGLDRPTTGQVLVGGRDLAKLKERELVSFRRKTVAFVFQQFQLISVLTAEENVSLPLVLAGCSNTEATRRAREALDLVGLSDRAGHRPAELSGGQQQRVALARALVIQPDVLLADEPTGNLDSQNAQHIRQLLRRFSEELQQTVILVTHDPLSATIADRVLHLHDGELVREEVNRPCGPR